MLVSTVANDNVLAVFTRCSFEQEVGLDPNSVHILGDSNNAEAQLEQARCTLQHLELEEQCKVDRQDERVQAREEDPWIMLEVSTHSSAATTDVSSFDRVELKSDAVLDKTVMLTLHKDDPDLPTRHLANLKSVAVQNDSFTALAVELNLISFIKVSNKILDKHINGAIRKITKNQKKNTPRTLLGRCCHP